MGWLLFFDLWIEIVWKGQCPCYGQVIFWLYVLDVWMQPWKFCRLPPPQWSATPASSTCLCWIRDEVTTTLCSLCGCNSTLHHAQQLRSSWTSNLDRIFVGNAVLHHGGTFGLVDFLSSSLRQSAAQQACIAWRFHARFFCSLISGFHIVFMFIDVMLISWLHAYFMFSFLPCLWHMACCLVLSALRNVAHLWVGGWGGRWC